MIGKWGGEVQAPPTARLPEANPVVEFEFGSVQRIFLDSLTVTITNMTDTLLRVVVCDLRL